MPVEVSPVRKHPLLHGGCFDSLLHPGSPPPQPCDPLGDGDWFASLRGHSSWTVLFPTSVFQASGIQAWKDVGTW